MNNTTVNSVGERAWTSVKSFFSSLGNLAGHGVQYIKDIPTTMQQSKNTAIGVFAAANAVIYYIANKVTSLVEGRIDGSLDKKGSSTLKFIGSNFLFGGIVASSNYGLSLATKYPLAPKVLALGTAGVIALRILLNFKSDSDDATQVPAK